MNKKWQKQKNQIGGKPAHGKSAGSSPGRDPQNRRDNNSPKRHETSPRHEQKKPPVDWSIRRVVGIHSARETIRVRPTKIKEIWLKTGAERSSDLNYFFEAGHKFKIPVVIKPESVLDQIAASNQGVCLLVTETPSLNFENLVQTENSKIVLLALDEITDPHNVGAMMRSAWLFDVAGIIVPQNRSSHLTPAAIKVASGAAEHIPLFISSNLAIELTSLKDKGFWIYGLAGGSENNLTNTRFHERIVIVIGAEDRGLRSTTTKVCDELISIPQSSANEAGASFNASVAAAIAMYEVNKQHKNS